MAVTVAIMVAIGAVVGLVAWWQSTARQSTARRSAPTVLPGAPPGQLDRQDFRAPDAPLLIAVFTSKSCSSCETVWAELAGYESATVATQNVEVLDQSDLHRRYQIESVPTAVIVDTSGETQAAFVGPLGNDHRQTLRQVITSANR